ncbi:Peptidase family M1 [Gillisia sp. Hel1_33_143]|uniref:M1 family metallopeptidase n=1 Tax=Gillisia sp. Hel1_33_143 TaxID=1336796 RepID=UPI00087D7DD5|nr:M1 family metallopeptidase [Gillisia sp. Hel1_33_143]SDS36894.1 Peptidase family M1 [Gillisia sp. Hel1_33_143]
MKNTISIIIFAICISIFNSSCAQVLSDKQQNYNAGDTLRGSLRAERNYEVLKYHLQVRVNPEKKFISGSNTITFQAAQELPIMQVDLFENMQVDSIIHLGKKLDYRREYNAVFIDLNKKTSASAKDSIQFFYSGNPIVAKNAPWDGGFVWKTDENGDPWIAVAVQGTGASLWYPNKDHQSDEPEEALIEIAVPNDLINVSNGRFIGKQDLGDGYTQWSWKVNSPINNYDIVVNIANYEHFHDTYKNLDLDYYVLPYNLEKAKKEFEEVKLMMDCFYNKMGPYPFEEDGYKLVETPYLGMEHQSAVAYGNNYGYGYLGRDLSGTAIGMNWDYIIIHESGHEWYGNSITAKDIADMWIHESFTSYTEAIYVECRWGKDKSLEYLRGTRKGVRNTAPIIGDYGVNSEGSGDMYFKGANLLNNLRSIYNNDELWWNTLRAYTKTYRHKIIETKTVEDYFNAPIKEDLAPIFDQYLRHSKLPVLQFKMNGNKVLYRWQADVENFKMPVSVFVKNKEIRITPTSKWQSLKENIKRKDQIRVNDLKYYVDSEFVN